MAKTFGWLDLAQRNDRIFKAALAGAIIYACAVLAVAPSTPAQAHTLISLRGGAGIGDQLLTGSGERHLSGTLNHVRNLVNTPSYAAYLHEKNCLAQAIYFEARGESQLGQKAVAEVVLARTRERDRPKTICGVVYEGAHNASGYCQFSFACDGISDKVRDRGAWSRAQRIASNTMRTGGRVNSVVGNATYYHAEYVKPSWASSMVKVAQIGTHIFYRERHHG